jgi:hypothetical protein
MQQRQEFLMRVRIEDEDPLIEVDLLLPRVGLTGRLCANRPFVSVIGLHLKTFCDAGCDDTMVAADEPWSKA